MKIRFKFEKDFPYSFYKTKNYVFLPKPFIDCTVLRRPLLNENLCNIINALNFRCSRGGNILSILIIDYFQDRDNL